MKTSDWRSPPHLGSLAAMRWISATAALLLSLAPASALAHPLLDEARRAYNATQHERGLELLDQAEAGTDLTRDDLVELLLLRAMMHRAQRQMDLAEVDLLRLAGLDPTRQLGREIHPSLRRLFDTVRERVPGPVRLELAAERNGDIVRVRVTVADDVAALTQAFRLYARPEGGSWRETEQATLEIDVRPSQAAEYYAEAIGPGGAVIATSGSRDAPSRLEPEGGAIAEVGGEGDVGAGAGSGSESGAGGTEQPPPPGGGDDVGLWVGLGVGAAVLVAAAIVIGVLVATPTDETQLTQPSVEPLVSAPFPLLSFD